MLKLKDISNTYSVSNESDFYIKVKIVFGGRNSMQSQICYWSTSGPEESLIEICLNKQTGAIYKITVVSVATIHYQDIPLIKNGNFIEKIGLPLFETTTWESDQNDLGANKN